MVVCYAWGRTLYPNSISHFPLVPMRQPQPSELNLAHLVRPAGKAGGPGLLLLHGRGADEEDLMGLVGALGPRLVGGRARGPFRWGAGFAWYGTEGEEAETMQASLEELRSFVDDLPAAYGIDPNRLYAMGFSQGAVMGAALALTVPEQVRGVVMHSGYVPTRSGLPLRPE